MFNFGLGDLDLAEGIPAMVQAVQQKPRDKISRQKSQLHAVGYYPLLLSKQYQNT